MNRPTAKAVIEFAKRVEPAYRLLAYPLTRFHEGKSVPYWPTAEEIVSIADRLIGLVESGRRSDCGQCGIYARVSADGDGIDLGFYFAADDEPWITVREDLLGKMPKEDIQ